MGKKVKNEREQKENTKEKKNINLSHMIRSIKQKRLLKNKSDIPKLNPIIFQINENPLNQEEFEKEYDKRQLYYLKEELSCKIITMFFNYISSSSIIPIPFKNNIYFIQEFLKIIIDLLINEIDFATVTLIFDKMGWVGQGSDPWPYINYICLCAKDKSSSQNAFTILSQILDKNNKGFKDSYDKWVNNANIKEKLKKISINEINQRFTELIKPIYFDENHKKYINYNEIVNKILLMSNHKDIVMPKNPLNPISLNLNNNITQNNQINQYKNTCDSMIEYDFANNRSVFEPSNCTNSPGKENQPKMLEMKKNSSFKLLDLSNAGSSSFIFRPLDMDLSRNSSTSFMNK